jgi:hypothetical protein
MFFSLNKINEKFFFSIKDSVVFIETNGSKVNLNLDQITNVRLIKNRNLSVNLILLYLSIIFYFTLLWNDYFVIQLMSVIIIITFIISAIFIKRFSYKLLVNKGVMGFSEFLVSKNNLLFVESFIYSIKNKKEVIRINNEISFN